VVAYILGALVNGVMWLQVKINENKYMAIIRADDMLTEELKSIIVGLQDELVEGLKKSAVDGKLTKDEIDELKSKAVARLKAGVSKDKMAEIRKQFGNDLTAVVAAKLPGLVALMKGRGFLGADSPEDPQ